MSLYKVMLTNRNLLYDSRGADFYRHYKGNDKDRLQLTGKMFKKIEYLIQRYRPDKIIYSSYDLAFPSTLIVYSLSRKYGIETFFPHHTGIGNCVTISNSPLFSNIITNNRPIKEDVRDIKTGKQSISYMSLSKKYSEYTTVKKILIKVYSIVQGILEGEKSIKYSWDQIRFILRNIIDYDRKYVSLDNPIAEELPSDFFYFPLHCEPEQSLLLWSPDFRDQKAVIRLIAQNLPYPYKMLVKEHPQMAGRRDPSFYHDIASMINVTLVSRNTDQEMLIEKSSAVVTIAGTAALEAALLSKKSAVFGDVFFSTYFKSIYKIDSIDSLMDFIDYVINDCTIDNKREIDIFMRELNESTVKFDPAHINSKDIDQILEDDAFQLYAEFLIRKLNSSHTKENTRS